MIKIGKGNFTKGNYTVECAMIMPIIFMCIISVLWLMIYMYNANIMYRALYHAVSAADYHNSKNNTQLKNEVEDRIYEDINGQLVGIKDGKVNVKVGKNSVTASIEGNLEYQHQLDFWASDCIYDVKMKSYIYSSDGYNYYCYSCCSCVIWINYNFQKKNIQD